MPSPAQQTRRQRAKRAAAIIERCPRDLTILEAQAAPLELLAAADGETAPKLRRFRMTAYTGGRLRLAAYEHPVVVDLSGVRIPGKSRPILRDHQLSAIVGHTEEIAVTAGTIRVVGVLSAANDAAREVSESAVNGFPWQASIGANADQMAFVDERETVQVNGRKFTGPLFVARKSTLKEISVVAIGADDNTNLSIAASAAPTPEGTNMTFEQWLQARGFDAAAITDAQETSLRAMYDAEQAAPPATPLATPPAAPPIQAAAPAGGTANADDEPDPAAAHVDAIRAAAAAELARHDAVRRICAQYGQPRFRVQNVEHDLCAHAIAEGWDATQCELEAMRASRPAAPAGHSRSTETDATVQALEGALLLRAGCRLDDPHYNSIQAHAMGLPQWLRAGLNEDGRQRAMEWAHRLSDLSMVDLCAHAVRIDGRQVPNGRHAMIQAAFSGSALTNIFTTNVNAALLVTYMQTPDTTRGWVSERDVADFKTNERLRMTKGPDLVKLPRGKAAEHAERSDLKESYKIARYAKQFGVDEQDIIDDSFGALADTPREFGQAAARLRPDLVYAILLANAALDADAVALFHADHNNLATTAALASATLKAAIAKIEIQRENGVNLNLRPSHLLVPSELKHTGAELLNSSSIVVAGNTDTVRGSANTIQSIEQLVLVSDSRLSNGVTDPDSGTAHAGSATTWFLAAASGHTIEVGYLRGTGRVPRVTGWRKNGEDGEYLLGWSVKLDIGAKALDFRGLEKNTA